MFVIPLQFWALSWFPFLHGFLIGFLDFACVFCLVVIVWIVCPVLWPIACFGFTILDYINKGLRSDPQPCVSEQIGDNIFLSLRFFIKNNHNLKNLFILYAHALPINPNHSRCSLLNIPVCLFVFKTQNLLQKNKI